MCICTFLNWCILIQPKQEEVYPILYISQMRYSTYLNWGNVYLLWINILFQTTWVIPLSFAQFSYIPGPDFFLDHWKPALPFLASLSWCAESCANFPARFRTVSCNLSAWSNFVSLMLECKWCFLSSSFNFFSKEYLESCMARMSSLRFFTSFSLLSKFTRSLFLQRRKKKRWH